MIPVNTPLLAGNEKAYLDECIETGWISSEGPFVARFEAEFANRVHRQHGVAVCNGTAAIDLAVAALGIKAGDEVIVPAFTIISCVLQIVRTGAVPVLVDCDPVTWNMDVTQIEAKITSRTRAIMAVHIYGLPVDMAPLLDVARRRGLSVIEDAAEAHGQTYGDEPCGSFGDISTFSFYANKHVTTGEGGMVLCNDDALAGHCRSLRNLCFEPQRRFVHQHLGWNMRMTNVQAALGVAQLEQLDGFIARKRRMGARYTERLADLTGVQLPEASTAHAKNTYWVYGLVLDASRAHRASDIMRQLGKKGIGTRPFFFPLHQQPVLREMGLCMNDRHPVSEHLYQHGFYIPSGLGLTDDQMDRVCDALWEVLG